MNGLQKELDVLKQIMNSDGPTKDAEFQKKVDEINKLYPSESDGDLIAAQLSRMVISQFRKMKVIRK